MTPTLSIIVPAYNVQNYIDACVQSILGQLGPQHELIVVDDGSSDNTLARIHALQNAHPKANMQVLSQANQGISATRNTGIGAARGQYLAFVDSDDILRDGALALIGQAIAEHGPDVIACDYRMWHPDREAKTRLVSLSYPVGQVVTDPAAILNTFFTDRQMYIWANIFRREIYAQLPTPIFPPGRVFEDVATVPRLLSQCASLLYLPQAIIDYRQHPASITRVITEKWCLDFAGALTLARHHLDQRGVAASVRAHFDIAAAYFYIGVAKESYQLPREVGRSVRAQIKTVFVESLYGDCDSMLADLESGRTLSKNPKMDADTIGQVRRALSGSILFDAAQSASRKLKLWRRMRKTAQAA